MACNGVYLFATLSIIATLAVTQTHSSQVPPKREVAPAETENCDDLTGRWQATNPDMTLCIEVSPETGEMLTLIRNGSNLYFLFGFGMAVFGDHRHLGFTTMDSVGSSEVSGYTGECHKCEGNEVIIMTTVSRNKARSPECGISDGVRTVDQYVLTRTGPACRGTVLDVHNPNPRLLNKMGVRARSAVAN